MISGIIEPDNGNVLIDNYDLYNEKSDAYKGLRKKISFVFKEGALLSNLTILENLLLPFNFHFPEIPFEKKIEKIKEYFNRFELPEVILNYRPARLQGHISKLILFVRAYITNPSIIVYNNPYNGLNTKNRNVITNEILKFYSEDFVTQIFSSDNYTILFDTADVVLVYNNGNIIEQGRWEELQNSNSTITQEIIRGYSEA